MRFLGRFQRMMYGRYGQDQLGMFCFVMYVVLWLVSMFFRGTRIALVLNVLEIMLVAVYFFRFFSRNIYKRQMENRKFLAVWNRVKSFFKFYQMRFRERNGVKKLYRCPKCHQIIRVPKGRGKIAISCPKCRFEFIKRT